MLREQYQMSREKDERSIPRHKKTKELRSIPRHKERRSWEIHAKTQTEMELKDHYQDTRRDGAERSM